MIFDWFRRRRQVTRPEASVVWRVYLDGGDVVAEDGRGGTRRAAVSGANRVRVVPLGGGDHHAQSGRGWQVTLARSEGDVLLGGSLPDWQAARELARLVCERTMLPLDELTERLFSRVGQYTR